MIYLGLNNMNKTEEFIKKYQEHVNEINGNNINYRRMYPYSTVITILDEYIKEFKSNIDTEDATKDLLNDIISWKYDLTNRNSLESLLQLKYNITKKYETND